MKTMMRVLMGLLLAGVMFTAPGCKAAEGFLVKKKPVELRAAQTNVVEVVSTNVVDVVEQKTESVVVKPAETQADGTVVPAVIDTRVVYLTNQVPTLVTQRVEVVTPPVVYEEMSINPTVQQGAERVAGMTGIPWLDTGVMALGGLGTLVFSFLNRRNAKRALNLADGLQEKESKLETAGMVARTLVENVETIRKTLRAVPGGAELDEKAVRAMQQVQAAAGVKLQIAGIVEEHTDYTKGN